MSTISTEDLPRGATIGRHIVIKKLGAGGMGVVYAAYDPELSRKVAIKLLLRGGGGSQGDSAGRMRLMREAQAMARLSHPNVVSVFDVGQAFEQVFVSMEFVEGGTLSEWLERGSHSVLDILTMFHGAGCGLAAAHAAGLIHRDFKPDNVLVGLEGRPRVTDFGLAREMTGDAPVEKQAPAAGHSSSSTPSTMKRLAGLPPEIQAAIAGSQPLTAPLTHAGALMGTPRYMAPEQFRCQPTDARTDLFSFCVALYEALYGIQPFAGDTVAELCLNRIEGRVQHTPARRGVPAAVHRAIMRGLSVDPKERQQTMDELLAVLSPESHRQRRRTLLTVGAVAAIGTIALSLWGINRVQILRKVRACNDVSAQLSRVWGIDAREQARNGVLATKATYAPDVWERVSTNVEKYLAEWRAMRSESCHLTFVTRKQNRALNNRRLRCLDFKLQEVAAFAELLRNADEEMLDRAAETSSDFSSLNHCADREALNVETPDSPEMLAKVTQVYTEMATIKVMERLGRFTQARQRSQSLVKTAEEIAYPPATTRALWQLGHIYGNSSDFPAAERSFFGAALAGIRAGDHRETANAYAELMRLTGRLQQFEQSDRYHQLAMAELARVGGEPRERVLAESIVTWYACQVDTQRREYKRAEENCTNALTLYQRSAAADKPPVFIYTSLANIYRREGRFEEALRLYRQSLDVLQVSPGPEHPRTGSALFNIGSLHAIQGQNNEAFEFFRRTLSIYRRSFGERSPKLFEPLREMARWSYKANKPAEALGYARQAFEIVRDSNDVKQVAEGRRLIGEVLYRQERYADALVENQAALDMCDPRRCDQTMSAHLVAVGDDLRALKRTKEALPLLEQAQRLLPQNADKELQARAQFALAQVLPPPSLNKKGPPARTPRELAENAQRLYKELGKANRYELAEVEAWLAKNR